MTEDEKWRATHNLTKVGIVVSGVLATVAIAVAFIPANRQADAAEGSLKAQTTEPGVRQDVTVRPGSQFELGQKSLDAIVGARGTAATPFNQANYSPTRPILPAARSVGTERSLAPPIGRARPATPRDLPADKEASHERFDAPVAVD